MARYVIIIEDEDGSTTCYGTWRSADIAIDYANRLRAQSRRYGADDDAPDFGVSVESIQRWPGIRAALL